jgi:hypothetical protein
LDEGLLKAPHERLFGVGPLPQIPLGHAEQPPGVAVVYLALGAGVAVVAAINYI